MLRIKAPSHVNNLTADKDQASHLALVDLCQDQGVLGTPFKILSPNSESVAPCTSALQILAPIADDLVLAFVDQGYDDLITRVCVTRWDLSPSLDAAPVFRGPCSQCSHDSEGTVFHLRNKY